MIVLGIDPGAATTGYGVVARASGGAVSLLECGVVRTQSGQPLSVRLRQIYEGLSNVLSRHAVNALAVESVFFARNVRTTVVLGHARGAAILAGAMHDLEVAEYAPAEIKQTIAGSGRASKEQVQFMVQQLLHLRTPPRPSDAADAVAVALCHCSTGTLLQRVRALGS